MAQDKKQNPTPQPSKGQESNRGVVEYGETVSNTYKPPANPHNTSKVPEKGKK